MRPFIRPDLVLRAVAIAAFIVCMAAAKPSLADGVPMVLPDSPSPLIFKTAMGERKFTVELADNPEKRERGLMFRRSMPNDHGMLFIFPGPGQIAFWMKNTPMALDMVFIGSHGKVRAIKRGEPFSEANVSPGVPVQFVLELKAGTAQKNGIKVGDEVRHPAIEGGGSKG